MGVRAVLDAFVGALGDETSTPVVKPEAKPSVYAALRRGVVGAEAEEASARSERMAAGR